MSDAPASIPTPLIDSHPAPIPPRADSGKHLPALDGFRGAAILFVFLYHLIKIEGGTRLDNVIRFPADFGWIGVDLFFVLSGFLITGILYDAKGASHYFRNFYARRTLRIFPLYYLFLICFLVVLPMLSPALGNEIASAPLHPSYYWAYASNYAVALIDHGRGGALSVTWSLAIEEQFYLVWPAVVLLLSRRRLMGVCGGIIVAAFICRSFLVLNGAGWSPLYYLTQCRMDSLAFGALCALGIRGRDGVAGFWRSARWGLLSAVVVLTAVLVRQRTFHWVGGLGQSVGYSAVGAIAAGLLLLALMSEPTHWYHRFLASAPMRFFGRYSYGIYLFHLPVARYVLGHVYPQKNFLQFGQSKTPGQLLFYLVCALPTIGLALVSWNLFEKPILRLKRYFPSHSTGGKKKTPEASPGFPAREVSLATSPSITPPI